MHYRMVPLSDGATAGILGQTLDWIGRDPQMQRDRQRLEMVCCAPQKFVRLQGAPLPARAE